jgi:hypothetical protein
MPKPLWIDLMALLYFARVSTCTTIAEAMADASHDRLTRMLHGTWSGQTLLDLALRTLFTVAGGYLIVDDTVMEKGYARCLGEAAWVWSNKSSRLSSASPWCYWSGPMAGARFPSPFGCGTRGARQNTSWPWTSSAMRGIGSSASPSLCCLVAHGCFDNTHMQELKA